MRLQGKYILFFSYTGLAAVAPSGLAMRGLFRRVDLTGCKFFSFAFLLLCISGCNIHIAFQQFLLEMMPGSVDVSRTVHSL
jgi:hypothetical protein